MANRFGNFIADENRWNLECPPDFVLEALWNFDHMLVVIPSKAERGYLLARRRQYSAGMSDTVLLENRHPDTNMLMVHRCLPVAPLVFKNGVIKWEQRDIEGLIAHLRSRDTWALTGGPDGDADRAWQNLEYEEKREKEKNRRTMWEDFHHRGRDAFRSIQARMGWRNRRASDAHGHAKPANSGPVQQPSQRVTLT